MFAKLRKVLIKTGVTSNTLHKYIEFAEAVSKELDFVNREFVMYYSTSPKERSTVEIIFDVMDFGEWARINNKIMVFDILDSQYILFDENDNAKGEWQKA